MNRWKFWVYVLGIALAATFCRGVVRSSRGSAKGKYQLRAAFEFQRDEYMLGEPIIVVFKVQNLQDKDLFYDHGGDYRLTGRHDRFSFVATKTDGQVVRDPARYSGMGGGLGGKRRVRAGEIVTEYLVLNKWCAFSEPGSYTVTCTRTLNISAVSSLRETDEEKVDLPIETALKLHLTPTDVSEIKKRLAPWLAKMRDSRHEEFWLASDAVIAVADETILEELLEVLKSPNPEVRQKAVRALGKINTSEVHVVLAGALKDESEQIRRLAARQIESLRASDCVPSLIEALADLEQSVRSSVIGALNRISDPRAIRPLARILSTDTPRCRSKAAAALGAIGHPECRPALVSALEDEDENVRRRAIRALARFCDESVIPEIEKLKTDKSKSVRSTVEWAIDLIRTGKGDIIEDY